MADITFNFWYRLSELLYQRNSDDLTNIFKPYIARLVVALCKHCQIDTDHVSIAYRGMPISHSYFNTFFKGSII